MWPCFGAIRYVFLKRKLKILVGAIHTLYSIHGDENNLYLRNKIEPVIAGADATVYICLVSGPDILYVYSVLVCTVCMPYSTNAKRTVYRKEYILVIECTAPPASSKDVPTQPLPALSVVYIEYTR